MSAFVLFLGTSGSQREGNWNLSCPLEMAATTDICCCKFRLLIFRASTIWKRLGEQGVSWKLQAKNVVFENEREQVKPEHFC